MRQGFLSLYYSFHEREANNKLPQAKVKGIIVYETYS